MDRSIQCICEVNTPSRQCKTMPGSSCSCAFSWVSFWYVQYPQVLHRNSSIQMHPAREQAPLQIPNGLFWKTDHVPVAPQDLQSASTCFPTLHRVNRVPARVQTQSGRSTK